MLRVSRIIMIKQIWKFLSICLAVVKYVVLYAVLEWAFQDQLVMSKIELTVSEQPWYRGWTAF